MDGGGLAKRPIGSETGVRYFIIHFSREARKHREGGPENVTAEKLEAKFDPPPGLRTSDSQDATPVGQVRPLLARVGQNPAPNSEGGEGRRVPLLTQKLKRCMISKRLMQYGKGSRNPWGPQRDQ